MKKAVLFFYLTCCSFLFACDKEENTVKPVNSKPTIPVIIPDVETISATIEADGSMRLTGKINKIDPNALDYGFIATQDSLFGPVWKIVGMNSKPVTGTYSLNIKNDTRFEKGKKYYFSAAIESSKLICKKYNVMTFVVPN